MITHDEHSRLSDDGCPNGHSFPDVECPRCHLESEDADGFGLVFCPHCHYCTHPSCSADSNGQMRCDVCGDVVEHFTGDEPSMRAVDHEENNPHCTDL
jgi:hypothetical protein